MSDPLRQRLLGFGLNEGCIASRTHFFLMTGPRQGLCGEVCPDASAFLFDSEGQKMCDDSRSREATATIRGYMYQFHATISAILGLDVNEVLTIEGIEDFDIEGDGASDLYQCKYYTSERLTDSTIRDAILPMLHGFLSADDQTRRERRHHLYGYFKDSSPAQKTLTTQELRRTLVRRKRTKLPSGKTKIEVINLQNELGATDNDLDFFARSLTIHICGEYEEHKKGVIEALKKAFGVSLIEASQYIYPSALTLVSGLAATAGQPERQVRRGHFIQQLRPSRALYNIWTLREKGEKAYCRDIQSAYFSVQNIDPVHRFFVIEPTNGVTNVQLLEFLHALRKKWSSHKVRRKPNDERYAPYVHFRGLSNDRLISLKAELQAQGVKFVDGHAFLGSEFSVEHVCSAQTYDNQISLRFVNSEADLRNCLQSMKERRSVYEFFHEKAMTEVTVCPHISIPVTSTGMISLMI